MARAKVLVTRAWPAEVEARLAVGYEVTLNPADTEPLRQGPDPGGTDRGGGGL